MTPLPSPRKPGRYAHALALACSLPAAAGAQTPTPAQSPSAAPSATAPAATAPAATAPAATAPHAQTPPAAAHPTPAETQSGPVVQRVEVEDRPLRDEPAANVYEPPVPPPPVPLKPDERAALLFALGFATSFGDIDKAFPWGFNVGFGGSLRVAKPVHVTLGVQFSVLHLRNAGSTGYYTCDYYYGRCSEETESGSLVALPVGLATHLPVGDHRFVLGAGGLYAWYGATTFQDTGVRSGPGVFSRFTWSIPGYRSLYYELFSEGALIFSDGERFVGRIDSTSSTDFWLNFGLALRFLL